MTTQTTTHPVRYGPSARTTRSSTLALFALLVAGVAAMLVATTFGATGAGGLALAAAVFAAVALVTPYVVLGVARRTFEFVGARG
jgi:hypothetical protein